MIFHVKGNAVSIDNIAVAVTANHDPNGFSLRFTKESDAFLNEAQKRVLFAKVKRGVLSSNI